RKQERETTTAKTTAMATTEPMMILIFLRSPAMASSMSSLSKEFDNTMKIGRENQDHGRFKLKKSMTAMI
ncbi:hypothetical protein Drorol1_Dr00010523, partial [Drosera rotundifolia]